MALFKGKDSDGNDCDYAYAEARIIDPTNGSEDGEFVIGAVVGGAAGDKISMGDGVKVGAATGGTNGYMGAGTLNVATNVYKNGTAYTNPDYVFEHHYTGKIERFAKNEGAEAYEGRLPLDELRFFTRDNWRLPRINDEPTGIFDRADIALEKLEEMTLYILELHDRISMLEQKH